MLTILGDALLEASRQKPQQNAPWADRFVPRARREAEEDKGPASNVRRYLWRRF